MSANKLPPVSFEFFPPQTDEGLKNLSKTALKLSEYSPEYFSVTFGAGGSTQERSMQAIDMLIATTDIPIAPHISCIGSTEDNVAQLLDTYRAKGIDRLVALRGDIPSGTGVFSGDFCYAQELVEFIRKHSGDHFHLSVAVYPECHPEANSMVENLKHFKNKVDAGANNAITQYFYNADAYDHLISDCKELNIKTPIVPGIMPITNYKQLARFSDTCGADLPRWIRKRLDAHDEDLESIRKLGAKITTKLCEKIIDMGAPGLHFYTLNKAEASSYTLDYLQAKYARTKETV
jgi:methylenetetrahydrofolate reductase (NADPH)